MTLAEALAAEARGEGSVRFIWGRPVWTWQAVRFPPKAVPRDDVKVRAVAR